MDKFAERANVYYDLLEKINFSGFNPEQAEQVKAELAAIDKFATKYAKPLRGALKSELSGDYKRLAIAWVTVPDELEMPAEPIELPADDDPDDDAEMGEESDQEEEPAEPEEENHPDSAPGKSGYDGLGSFKASNASTTGGSRSHEAQRLSLQEWRVQRAL